MALGTTSVPPRKVPVDGYDSLHRAKLAIGFEMVPRLPLVVNVGLGTPHREYHFICVGYPAPPIFSASNTSEKKSVFLQGNMSNLPEDLGWSRFHVGGIQWPSWVVNIH